MIPVPAGVRVWLASGVTDMRKGMNGAALVSLKVSANRSVENDGRGGRAQIGRTSVETLVADEPLGVAPTFVELALEFLRNTSPKLQRRHFAVEVVPSPVDPGADEELPPRQLGHPPVRKGLHGGNRAIDEEGNGVEIID